MTTQNAAILRHLRSGATLTPLGALSLFGCLRLSGRILELRRQGYAIETHTVRSGRKSFAEYKLVDAARCAPTISSSDTQLAAGRAHI